MWIVDVEVHQYYGLPGAERRTTPGHRQSDRGAYERGEDVVGPVTERTVGMPVSIITRQQPVQSVDEICFGTRSRFHKCDASSGMRHEYVDETLVIAEAESFKFLREIDYPVP